MKKKSKLDAKAIKQFFIDHTEKIVIGVVGLLFLYFTYSAVMLQANDSYKKEPKNLADVVQAAQTTMVAGPKLKTPVTEAPIPPYAKYIERFKEPEDPNKYSFAEKMYPTVLAQRNPRGTPAVIPVEELRAIAGRGALGGKDNGASTVGQRWVVVTGMVPYAKQLAEYKSRFETAGFQGEHDTPEYVGFLVQRAEVAPGTAGEPKWEKAVTVCNASFFSSQLQKWTGTGLEVVDSKYVYSGLTSQLPARTIGEWGDEAAHPSEIKLLTPEERDQTLGGQGGQFPVAPNGPPTGGHGGRMPPGGDGRFIRGARGPASAEGGRFPPGAPRAGGDQSGDDLFDETAAGAKNDAANNKPVDEAAQVPPYYLLRYFDFDVEPGKQYAYRVYLRLRNPNYALPESVLFEPKQSSQKMLSVTPGKDRPDVNNKVADLQIGPYWSNTCQSTRLPGDSRLIAGAVDPAKSPSPTEITGQVRIVRWDPETGANKHADKAPIFRGTAIDSAFEGAGWQPKVEGDTNQEPKAETNSILVDWTGGELLSPRDREKSPHSPGAMLVVADNGELVIHDEMGETKEWNDATKEPDRPSTDGGRRGFQGPERGRFQRGRGERGGPRAPGGGPDSSLPDMAPSGGR